MIVKFCLCGCISARGNQGARVSGHISQTDLVDQRGGDNGVEVWRVLVDDFVFADSNTHRKRITSSRQRVVDGCGNDEVASAIVLEAVDGTDFSAAGLMFEKQGNIPTP